MRCGCQARLECAQGWCCASASWGRVRGGVIARGRRVGRNTVWRERGVRERDRRGGRDGGTVSAHVTRPQSRARLGSSHVIGAIRDHVLGQVIGRQSRDRSRSHARAAVGVLSPGARRERGVYSTAAPPPLVGAGDSDETDSLRSAPERNRDRAREALRSGVTGFGVVPGIRCAAACLPSRPGSRLVAASCSLRGAGYGHALPKLIARYPQVGLRGWRGGRANKKTQSG